MSERFTVDFYNSEQYEKLFAEVSYGGQPLCQINQDQGLNNLGVEFFYKQRVSDNQPQLKFPLEELLSAIEVAVDRFVIEEFLS